jgi:hypothetical protein
LAVAIPAMGVNGVQDEHYVSDEEHDAQPGEDPAQD